MHLAIDVDSHWVRTAALNSRKQPQLIRIGHSTAAMPAVVRQTMHGLVVGTEAAESLVGNSETTVTSGNRLMGRASTVSRHLTERLPYSVREVGGELLCNLLYAELPASEWYGSLVQAAMARVEQETETRVNDVVLTVPASADDRYRIHVRRAVEAKGIKVRRLVNQPTAALLAATLPANARRVAVVHCGHATTDVTIAEITTDNTTRGVRVLATVGDSLLGGDDMVWAITERVAEGVEKRTGISMRQVDGSGVALHGLHTAIQGILPTVAFDDAAMLVLDHGGGFGRDLVLPIARVDVEKWIQPYVGKVLDLCRRARRDSHLSSVDAVLFTGAMTYWMPLQTAIARAFDTSPDDLIVDLNDDLVVRGAALATADAASTIWDVTPYPVGINCYYGNTELFSPILPANTPIPTPPLGQPGAFTEPYITRFPDQTSVRLDILQYRGDRVPATQGVNRVYPNECETLGTWSFDNLKPKPGHYSDFTVTFAIDRDGILHLQAVETATNHTLTAHVERGIG